MIACCGQAPPAAPSLLHRLDPRFRLIILFLLAFTYSFITDPRLLAAMVAATLALLLLSGQSAGLVLKKLRLPSLVILALVVTLPLVSGEQTVLSLGGLTVKREGLAAAGLIAGRFFCIITTVMIILHTAPLLTHIKAMRALGLPWIMADMALLTGRYLEVLAADLRQMQTASRLRGFNTGAWSIAALRTRAWLCGSLLVRGLERADWVYRAMRLRGYGRVRLPANGGYRAGSLDFGVLLMVLLATTTLAGLEIWLT